MPIVLKSGSLNLLDPSGPVQACDGIALPFNVLDSVSADWLSLLSFFIIFLIHLREIQEYHYQTEKGKLQRPGTKLP